MDIAMTFRTLDTAAADLGGLTGKTALVRVDFNVPMEDGGSPTTPACASPCRRSSGCAMPGAKVALLAHFDRPKGKVVPSMSLQARGRRSGTAAGRARSGSPTTASATTRKPPSPTSTPAAVILLENVRFHAGEETNDPAFAAGTGRPRRPLCQRRLLRRAPRPCLDRGPGASAARLCRGSRCGASSTPWTPRWAIRRSRCSASSAGPRSRPSWTCSRTWSAKLDRLAIGGGMANTFLFAQGIDIGGSLAERDMADTAREIIAEADGQGLRTAAAGRLRRGHRGQARRGQPHRRGRSSPCPPTTRSSTPAPPRSPAWSRP